MTETITSSAGDALVMTGAVAAPILFGGLLLLAVRRRWTVAGAPLPRWASVAAGNLLLTGLLVSALFLAAECYYRFFFDQSDGFGLTRVHRRWRERHYRLNRAGVRDDVEYLLWPAAGKRRLLVLGDSFTAGHGVAVEERFANLVRRELAEGWEVHVLARDGWSTGTELAALEKLIPEYRVDAVALIYVLNDTAELIPEWRGILKRLYRGRTEDGFLVRHSYVANLVRYRWELRRSPDLSRFFELLRASYDPPLFDRQRALLEAVVRACRSRGSALAVVTFPLLQDLGPGYPYGEAHRRLGAFWSEAGVPHLDLLPLFRGKDPRDLVVSRWDYHPNAAAHRMAADAIARFLAGSFPAALPAAALTPGTGSATMGSP